MRKRLPNLNYLVLFVLLFANTLKAARAVEELDPKAVNVYMEFLRAEYLAKDVEQVKPYLSEVEGKEIDKLKTEREKAWKLRLYKSQYIVKPKFYQGERDGDYLKMIGSGYIYKDGKLFPGDLVVTMHLEHNVWKVWTRAFNNGTHVRSF